MPVSVRHPGVEIETGLNPTAAVILMHGLGADGNDFVPIAHELDLRPSGRCASCSPTRR